MQYDWLAFIRGRIYRKLGKSKRKQRPLESKTDLEPKIMLSAVAVGPEFSVNNVTEFSQMKPSIATDSQGGFVTAWWSINSGGISARRYQPDGTPLGTEFQVNSDVFSTPTHASVAMSDNGIFVLAWERENHDIYARIYNSNGTPKGVEFKVNSYTTGTQAFPDVAMDSDGDFVITWQSDEQDGSGHGIYGQRYDSNGVKLGSEFKVNSFTTGSQTNPSVSMDNSGDFVIAWQSDGQDGDQPGIYAQRYRSDGIVQQYNFLVNQYFTNAQISPDVSCDATGNFVIAWQSNQQDGDGYGIFARRYNESGLPTGPEFRVSTSTNGQQVYPAISLDEDGDFIITWSSDWTENRSYAVYYQRYSKAGTALAPETKLSTSLNTPQQESDIALTPIGDFIISWKSHVYEQGNAAGHTDIHAQRFRISQTDNIGVWRDSRYYLDSNHSEKWDGANKDTLVSFGSQIDTPLSGDWNGDGHSEIGAWRNGVFFLDINENGTWDGPIIDRKFTFGNSTDIPLIGDWNKDGKDEIGSWRAGKFYLDMDGNGAWEGITVDSAVSFGSTTDWPIIGDWNADGKDDLGVWRKGRFYLDLNTNQTWNSGVDGIFTFGNPTDTPLIGDWNGDGTDDIGVWREGKFYRDFDGNHVWNSATDIVTTYGASTDSPVIGYWQPKPLPDTLLDGPPYSINLVPSSTIISGEIIPKKTQLAEVLATAISSISRKRKLNR